MQYLISFLEGIITFLSPCLLPMLPIYISYFAGGGVRSTRRTLTCAAGFVLGFTISFVAMGALAGTIGSALKAHQTAVNPSPPAWWVLLRSELSGRIPHSALPGRQRPGV